VSALPDTRLGECPPYERLTSDGEAYAASAASRVLAEGWVCGGYAPLRLDAEIPWSLADAELRSWSYHIHAWDMLDSLLAAYSETGDERFLRPAVRVALDWVGRYPRCSAADAAPLAWYDMAVGLRAYRMAYALDAGARAGLFCGPERDALWASLLEHQRYLADDANVAFHSNHGFFQVAGQLAMGRRFAGDSLAMAQAVEQGRARLGVMLHRQFAADGVHLEHSPDYHRMVLGTLRTMIDCGMVTDGETVARADAIERALAWFVSPCGHLVNFGDSDHRSLRCTPDEAGRLWRTPAMRYVTTGGRAGELPTARTASFRESGYFVARVAPEAAPPDFGRSSYLALMAGFHSRTHKHADDLSFVWSDRGSDLLVDAGRYGYIGRTEEGSDLWTEGHWYSDVRRVYCESTRAHNALELDGVDYRRKGVKPYGNALGRSLEAGHGIVAVEAECRHFGSVRHARVLVLLPGRWLLVQDWFNDSAQQAREARQWFHLAPHLRLEQDVAGFVASVPSAGEPLRVASLLASPAASRLYLGEETPQWQGWWSPKERRMIPNYAFHFGLAGTATGAFATLFAFGERLEPDTAWSGVNASGRNGRFRWRDDRGRHELRLHRPPEGDLGVDYSID
jgi:hypothetical protein